jgi:hypothetical protein
VVLPAASEATIKLQTISCRYSLALLFCRYCSCVRVNLQLSVAASSNLWRTLYRTMHGNFISAGTYFFQEQFTDGGTFGTGVLAKG